jgi:hypothetical protein
MRSTRQSPPRFPLTGVPGWNFYFYTYMNYSKQALNINQQIEQLQSRGLVIEDTNISFDKRQE